MPSHREPFWPWSTAAALALLLSAMPAQQRLATAGRVLDGAGKPLAGATVTFVGATLPLVDPFAPTDRIVATTDDKGRFRVELLALGDYVAWASAPPTAGAGACASALAMDVRAGTGVEFVAATPHANSVLRVDGLDGWPELAPLRVEVAPALPFVHAVPLALDGGTAPMPPAPAGLDVLVFVRDRHGAVLFACRQKATPGETRVALPPPQEIPVRVRDSAGAPVAGATLRLQVGHRLSSTSAWDFSDITPGWWRDVGSTAADGTAIVRAPTERDPFAWGSQDGLLLAAKPGHVAAISGWNGDVVVDGKLANRPVARELPFTLRAGPAWGGRVRGADGEGLADVVLRLEGVVSFVLPGMATKICQMALVTRSGADGAFAFDAVPPGMERPRLVASLPAHVEGAAPNGQALAWHLPDLTQSFDLDLRNLPLLTLRVRGADDGPSRHARVLVQRMPVPATHRGDRNLQIALDARGEGCLRLQPGRWSVSVFDRAGAVHRIVDLARDELLDLRLQYLTVVRGSLRRPDHSPAADATFAIFGNGGVARDEAANAAGACAIHMNRWLASRTALGPDGTFALPFFAVPGFEFRAQVTTSDRLVAHVKMQNNEEPVEIALRR